MVMTQKGHRKIKTWQITFVERKEIKNVKVKKSEIYECDRFWLVLQRVHKLPHVTSKWFLMYRVTNWWEGHFGMLKSAKHKQNMKFELFWGLLNFGSSGVSTNAVTAMYMQIVTLS
jgi:hypothetical protein